jgi:hypothetical protein
MCKNLPWLMMRTDLTTARGHHVFAIAVSMSRTFAWDAIDR